MNFGDGPEIPLAGGDVTEGVVRVGDTVRRPQGWHSPTVHRALTHLEVAGFQGAPRFLGIDSRGREVLSYLQGEVAGRPWPAWVADEDRMVSVARLVRELDDALRPLGIPAGHLPAPFPPDAPAPVWGPATQLSHRDVTPENVVFRQGLAYALIDFDLIQPSTRVQSVVNLLLWWAAWLDPADRQPVMRDLDPFRRGRLIAQAYELDDHDRTLIVPVAINTAAISWHTMQDRANRHGGGWRRMWDDGVGDVIQRRLAWLRRHQTELDQAITP